MSRQYEHCPVWDYWARGGHEGMRGGRAGGRRLGIPPVRPYRWRQSEAEREEWVASMVQVARRRARAVIVAEIEAGCWWVPKGFTVADLDALIAEVYG
jgi:hypothetical protein